MANTQTVSWYPLANPMTIQRRSVSMREHLVNLVESKPFSRFILVIIIMNRCVLGLETLPEVAAHSGVLLHALNTISIAIYATEAILKLVAHGSSYFRSGWNIFDFLIVITSVIPSGGVFSGLRMLRIVRTLQALRLVSGLAPMRKIVSAILRSLPGIGWTVVLLLLLYYVFSIIGIQLFGTEYPDFGSIGASFTTLFELTTLEGWQDTVMPITDVHNWAWIYFLTFIFLASFILLNVVVGIVVDSFEVAREEDEEAKTRKEPPWVGSSRTSKTLSPWASKIRRTAYSERYEKCSW